MGRRNGMWRAVPALLALTMVAGATACRPNAGDPLVNQSVEQDDNDDGVADCFGIEGWGANGWAQDRVTQPVDGNWGARIRMTSYTDGERALVPALTDDCAPATPPGGRFRASVAYRSTVPTGFVVYAQRATGWSLWFRGAAEPASAGFRTATVDLPAIPADVKGVSFGLAIHAVGELVTDRYTLVANPGAAPAAPAACPNGYAALTFDDGPEGMTPALLDTLSAKGARVTFFLIGQQVASYAPTVAREAREGHVVGNHSWTHPTLTDLTDTQIRDELTRTSNQIAAAGAPAPDVWRPPYGSTDARVAAVGTSLGMAQVLWNIDTNDWQGVSVPDTISRALDPMRAGSVVLFHSRMPNSVAAVPTIVDGMRKRGLCPGVMRPSATYNPVVGGYARVSPS